MESSNYRPGTKKLSGEIDAKLKDAFRAQTIRRGQIVNDVLAAAIRVWISLPAATQAEIVSEPIDNIIEFLRSRIAPSGDLHA